MCRFLEQLWALTGTPASSIGTLGCHITYHHQQKHLANEGLTSPPGDSLMPLISKKLHDYKIYHTILEASSHGLDQYRLDSLQFDGAIFSNFGRDHLDYHKTIDDYAQAKLRLFRELVKPNGFVVWHKKNALHKDLLHIANTKQYRYAILGQDCKIIHHQTSLQGQQFRLRYQKKTHIINLPLIGYFQAENAVLSLLMLLQGQELTSYHIHAMESLKPVQGRMQFVPNHLHKKVIIDYAHTPDALLTLLKAVKDHKPHRIILVFGCGGDRDKGKRPLMANIAQEYAQYIIVTDDNPRFEKASSIRQDMLSVLPHAKEIADRKQAIEHALHLAGEHDMVVIAGKGHEQGQEIEGIQYHFSDYDCVKEYFDHV